MRGELNRASRPNTFGSNGVVHGSFTTLDRGCTGGGSGPFGGTFAAHDVG